MEYTISMQEPLLYKKQDVQVSERLNLALNKQSRKKLNVIKRAYGIKKDNEAIRFAILFLPTDLKVN